MISLWGKPCRQEAWDRQKALPMPTPGTPDCAGEAFGDGRPGVAPVPSRGGAASGKAGGQAGGLLEGSSAATILLTQLGSPALRRGRAWCRHWRVMLEMVIGKKSLLAFLTSNWIRAVEAPQFGGGGHLASQKRGLECCHVWPGSPCPPDRLLSRGVCPIYRYSIVGDKRGVQKRACRISPAFLASSLVPSLRSHISAGSLIWSTRGFPRHPQFRLRMAGMVLEKNFYFRRAFPIQEEELFICWDPSGRPPITKVPRALEAPLSPYLTAREHDCPAFR